MADDDDTTTSGGEWLPPEEGTPSGEEGLPSGEESGAASRARDEDTLPTEDRPPRRAARSQDPGPSSDDEEDDLPPTGAHQIVFPSDDAEEEERLGGEIPSFEEYRRQREEGAGHGGGEIEPEWESAGASERPGEDEASEAYGTGEQEYARKMFGGHGRDHDEEESGGGEHHAHGDDGGDTLEGEDALEGVSLPEDGGPAFGSSLDDELAREAADLFPTGDEHTAEEIHQRRLEAHRRHRRNGRVRLLILVVVLALVAVGAVHELGGSSGPSKPPPKAATTPTSAGTGKGFLQAGSDPSVLPAENLLIADWGSHKLVVISRQGQRVWTYSRTASYVPAFNPDYAFFTADGKQIVITEESHQRVELLSVANRQLTFTYGHYAKPGGARNYLHDPSAALPERGEIVIADNRNCRVVAVRPPHHVVVSTLGRRGKCTHAPPSTFDSPVSAYPLSDGGTVVTESSGQIDLLDAGGKLASSFTVPGLTRPENVNEASDGELVGVDHAHPGAVVIFTQAGKVLWSYRKTIDGGELRDPSMAYVLPNGDVLVSDTFHDRVVVIDRKTQKIVWQYGRTRVPGGGNGYLDTPVGLDFVPRLSLLDQFPSAKPPR